jgi:hypothetical protein
MLPARAAFIASSVNLLEVTTKNLSDLNNPLVPKSCLELFLFLLPNDQTIHNKKTLAGVFLFPPMWGHFRDE